MYARLKSSRNKYLTLNKCPLGNYKKKNNKFDQTALKQLINLGQGNFRGVAKQCFN